MPTLQRTPPQRVNLPPLPSSPAAEADTTLPTPSQAFRLMNPGVRRTPPSGSTALPPPKTTITAAMTTPMEVEEIRGPEAGPSTTPPPEIPTSSADIRTSAPITPAPKTPRSTKKTAWKATTEPAVPIPIFDVDRTSEDWGKRYDITLDTLELAIRAGAQKWTAKNLEQCFPLLAAQHKKVIEGVYITCSQKMRTTILANAKEILEHYKVGPALQMIDQVVLDARENHSTSGRPDAWRPDASPYAVTTATNLPIYDEAYACLRAEYMALHEDCSSRFAAIRAKQEILREMEGAVSEGVVELEKTIKLLEGFPSEEMMQWMEDTVGKLAGGRAA